MKWEENLDNPQITIYSISVIIISDKCHRPVSSTSATFCNDKALQDQRFLNSSYLNVSHALSDTRVFGSDTTFLSFNLLPPPETPEVNYIKLNFFFTIKRTR